VLLVISHDRWFCDHVMNPIRNPDKKDDYRCSSLFVFEGNGTVSQFQGTYLDYFTALTARKDTSLGFTKYLTGFDFSPPLPVKTPIYSPPSDSKPTAVFTPMVKKNSRETGGPTKCATNTSTQIFATRFRTQAYKKFHL